MTKYHINPQTGNANICHAQTPESCKFYSKKRKELPPHFDTKEEAQSYYAESQKELLFACSVSLRRDENSFGDARALFGRKDVRKQLRAVSDYGDTDPIGVSTVELEGDAVGPMMYDKVQCCGVINHKKLDEDSYKSFGFGGADSKRIFSRRSQLGVRAEKNEDLICSDVENISDGHKKMIRSYTGEAYRWMNRGLYDPEGCQEHGFIKKDESLFTAIGALTTMTRSDGSSYVTQKNSSKVTAEDHADAVRTMDSVLSHSNGLQRTVYRSFDELEIPGPEGKHWDKVTLGQEVRNDTFLSTSSDFGVAHSFSHKSHSFVLEIKTASGVAVQKESHIQTEKETLIPRGSRFMVVGKHETDTKNISQEKTVFSSPVTIIQLVEINEEGEIVNHKNIRDTQRMRKEYTNKNSPVKWSN